MIYCRWRVIGHPSFSCSSKRDLGPYIWYHFLLENWRHWVEDRKGLCLKSIQRSLKNVSDSDQAKNPLVFYSLSKNQLPLFIISNRELVSVFVRLENKIVLNKIFLVMKISKSKFDSFLFEMLFFQQSSLIKQNLKNILFLIIILQMIKAHEFYQIIKLVIRFQTV